MEKKLTVLKNKLEKINIKLAKLESLLVYVPKKFDELEDEIFFSCLIDDISKDIIKDLILELIEEMSKYTSKEEIIKSLNYELKELNYTEIKF